MNNITYTRLEDGTFKKSTVIPEHVEEEIIKQEELDSSVNSITDSIKRLENEIVSLSELKDKQIASKQEEKAGLEQDLEVAKRNRDAILAQINNG
jgi:hypothetical protein